MPTALLEQPDLWPHLSPVLAAFDDLSADRPLGALGGAGPIPWSSLDRYAVRHGIDDPDEFERLTRLVKVLDVEHLKHLAEKMKAGGKR